MRGKPARRRVRLLALRAAAAACLLLSGAVVALTVAVACALWSPEPSPMRLIRNLGHWPAPMPAEVDPRPTMVNGSVSFGRGSFRSVGVLRTARAGVAQSALVSGWPFYALSSSTREQWGTPPGSPASGGIGWRAPVYTIPPGTQSFLRMNNSEVPLRPLWTGLILDSLVYALCLVLPAFILRLARQIIRRRRGRCVDCGYDLRGGFGPCPECGESAA